MRDDGNGSAAIMQHHPAGDVPTEDARLDDAIRRADELLVSSLKSEEQHRSRRRRTFTFTIVGGLIMIAATCVILAVLAQTGAVPGAEAAAQPSANVSAEALQAEGWQLWQARKLTEAEAKFEQAVKADPKHANAWNGLGWARLNQGKKDGAEKAFAEVVKLQPDHPAALNGLGWIEFGKRNYAPAEKHFLAAAANNASASWAGLAQLYLLQGKYEQALPWALLVSKEPGSDPAMAAQLIEAAKSKKLDPALKKQIEPEASKS
ncbi:MAG: tetratricopeptide repeat protein [Tepidisphaeraceae bacterium]